MDSLACNFRRVLTGRLSPEDIPPLKARVIRVYLCSVGTDSATERDIFQERVYPGLRSYCKDKYGLEFQVVDLKWGLPPETVETKTSSSTFWEGETETSDTTSAGPNLIIFIGQKYGPRSPPEVISSHDYDVIQVALRSHRGRDTRNVGLLNKCYVLDENNLTPVYVLQDKNVLEAELTKYAGEAGVAAEVKGHQLRAEVSRLLGKGAELAFLDGNMSSVAKDSFTCSDLEQEVSKALETKAQTPGQTILITREIVDLHNHLQHPSAAHYTDLRFNPKTDNFELDQDSGQRLTWFKERVTRQVSEKWRIQHQILWRYEEGVSASQHEEYLQELCQQLFDRCVRLIDHWGSRMLEQAELGPRPCQEALLHWRHCVHLASPVYNQSEVLSRLREYLRSASINPLILYGCTGCGKSKVISKLALEMKDILQEEDVFVLRYLGHVTRCVDIRQILIGLNAQVAMATGKAIDHVPADTQDLTVLFSHLMTLVPVSSRLVIVLDGLDQLLPDHLAFTLNWMPTALPPNVKVILTVHQSAHGLLTRLSKDLLPESPECFLEVSPIEIDECVELFMDTLLSSGRLLTPPQKEVFVSALQHEPTPLFAQLLARVAQNIRSSQIPDSIKIDTSSRQAIVGFLEEQEVKHGVVFVSRALSYLVASSTGLSDCEMEDQLSLDEDVLNEVYFDFHPAVRRVPCAKWLSLKQDLESLLTQREVDGVTVSSWRHDSFEHVVKDRYLKDVPTTQLIHSNSADYFLGTWSNRPKPVTFALSNISRIGRSSTKSVCLERKVSSQPHTYGGAHTGVVMFNRRMYDQVPRHLDLANRHKELDHMVLFNYNWLYNKIRALSLQEVLADFALHPSEEAQLVSQALRISEPVIEKDINNLSLELSGRLLPYYSSHPNIRSLIRLCDYDGLSQCALVPNFPYHGVPGGCLQFTLSCTTDMDQLLLLDQGRILACKEREDNFVHTYDLESGLLKSSVLVSVGELHATPDGKYFVLVDHVTEKAMKIHDAETGKFLKQVVLLNHLETKSSFYKSGPLCLTNDQLCAIVTLSNSMLCICDIPSGNVQSIVPLQGKCHICCLASNDRFVFCNSNNFIMAFDLTTCQHLLTLPFDNIPAILNFSKDGLRAYLTCDLDTRVTVIHINDDGAVDVTYRLGFEEKLKGNSIEGLVVSPDDSLLLLRSQRVLVVYHRVQEMITAVMEPPRHQPQEFRLPGSTKVSLVFTQAVFSRDSRFIVAAFFRSVYVWSALDGCLVTVLLGRIGVIRHLLVSDFNNLVVTHMQDSTDVQVWSLKEKTRPLPVPGKLRHPIVHFGSPTSNNLVFVQCRQADEIGVLDLRDGSMVDLLTHDSHVQDFASTPDGDWVLVATFPRLRDTAFKLWNIPERRVVMESGNVSGYCVSVNKLPYIIQFSQEENTFRSPYHVTLFECHTSGYRQQKCGATPVNHVVSKPFVTDNDQFLVVNSNTADQSTVEEIHTRPCLFIFNIQEGMSVCTWKAQTIHLEERLLDIADIRPCGTHNPNLVAVVFSCAAQNSISSDARSRNNPGSTSYGILLLDVSTCCPNLLCLPFPNPDSTFEGHHFLFAPDFTYCLDQSSAIFQIPSGECVGRLTSTSDPPQALALGGSVVLYYNRTVLYLVRLSDGQVMGRCQVHAPICRLQVCPDDRTLLVGCQDGSVRCYTIIDPRTESPTLILSQLPSRQVGGMEVAGDWTVLSEKKAGQPQKHLADFRPSTSTAPVSRDRTTWLSDIQRETPTQRSKSATLVLA